MRSARHTLPWSLAALPILALSAGCGGSPTAPSRDEVFYLHGSHLDKNFSYETYFPPLDQTATPRIPRIVGVGVLNGDVRFGRPIDWYVRAADYGAEHRFISYQSPRQFLFSIYERVDPVEDTWTDVLRRYEADVQQQGSQFLAARMPMATANTQGRGYLIKTKIPARPDFSGFAHEYIIRGDHRLLLVQITHSDNIESSADEMAAALKSIIAY